MPDNDDPQHRTPSPAPDGSPLEEGFLGAPDLDDPALEDQFAPATMPGVDPLATEETQESGEPARSAPALGERPEGRRNEDKKPQEPDEPPRPGGTREKAHVQPRPAGDDAVADAMDADCAASYRLGAREAYLDITTILAQPADPRNQLDRIKARCVAGCE